jgi:hypothetical protein
MEHLADQQLEQILAGAAPESPHLEECELCQGRLSEFRAIRQRLRVAFSSVHADDKLLQRVRSRLNAPSSDAAAPKRAAWQIRRIFWRAGAAAAALLLITIPIYLATSKMASAAESELFKIYQHSVSDHTGPYTDADPKKLAEYLKSDLGFKPGSEASKSEMVLRECCVAHFSSQPVGSYVVQTSRGAISLIVIKERSKSLGLKDELRRGNHTYMSGSYAKCKMVTSELNGYTYCAVGEVSHAFLADLLDQLVLYSQD